MTLLRSTINQANATDYRTFIGRAATLLFVLLITIGILLTWDEIGRLGAYGYPAVFLVSLISNAAFLLPAPGIAMVLAAGGVLDPIAVGVVAGLGAALGELTGYLVGQSGQPVFEDKPIYWRIESLMKKSGALVIFILAAVPNPIFDIGGLMAGALRMPVWRFLLGAWLGKSLRFVLLAALGSMAV
jgi:membrane protein YqaA with SNARE-associated domain